MLGEKTGGRKKGTPNRATKEIRDKIVQFVNDNADGFVTEWSKIKNPRDKAKLYLEACKFVLPSLQSVTLSDETAGEKSIEDDLRALSEPE